MPIQINLSKKSRVDKRLILCYGSECQRFILDFNSRLFLMSSFLYI